MIYHAVKLLAQQLNNYLATTDGNQAISDDFTQLRNVAHLSNEEIISLNNVLITLVNVTEETTAKNHPGNVRSIGAISPRHLSMYVLFSSCIYNSYEQSLKNLSHLIAFFEKNSVFSPQTQPNLDNAVGNFKLMVDSYSPSFEVSNNMWTTMGGKQFPHMLYRVRLEEIATQKPTERWGVIKQFELIERPASL